MGLNLEANLVVAVLVSLPVLFGILGLRAARYKVLVVVVATVMWVLMALFFVAVAAAEDVDPLWILALGPLLGSADATLVAPLIGAAVRVSMSSEQAAGRASREACRAARGSPPIHD